MYSQLLKKNGDWLLLKQSFSLPNLCIFILDGSLQQSLVARGRMEPNLNATATKDLIHDSRVEISRILSLFTLVHFISYYLYACFE